MGWCGNVGSSIVKSARLETWRSVVQIPVQVQIFLLKVEVVNSTRHEIYRLNLNYSQISSNNSWFETFVSVGRVIVRLLALSTRVRFPALLQFNILTKKPKIILKYIYEILIEKRIYHKKCNYQNNKYKTFRLIKARKPIKYK